MLPFERLRYLARYAGDDRELAIEAAQCLGEFGDDIPGLVAQGRTVAETLEIAQDVALGLIESYIEHGDELPPALKEVPAAVAGDLRIPITVP